MTGEKKKGKREEEGSRPLPGRAFGNLKKKEEAPGFLVKKGTNSITSLVWREGGDQFFSPLAAGRPRQAMLAMDLVLLKLKERGKGASTFLSLL